MLGGIDLRRLFNRPMVEPQNNVVIIVEPWSSYGDWLVRVVSEDGKGAGRIKTNAANGGRVNVLLVQDTLDRNTDTPPDIVG